MSTTNTSIHSTSKGSLERTALTENSHCSTVLLALSHEHKDTQ